MFKFLLKSLPFLFNIGAQLIGVTTNNKETNQAKEDINKLNKRISGLVEETRALKTKIVRLEHKVANLQLYLSFLAVVTLISLILSIIALATK